MLGGDRADDGSILVVQQNDSEKCVLRPYFLHDVDGLSCSGGEANQLGKGRPLSCKGDEDIQSTCAQSDGSQSVTN